MPLTILLNGKQLRDSNGRVLTPISATQFKIGSDLLHFQGKDRLQIEGHDGNIRKLHRELPVTTASTEENTGQYFSDEIRSEEHPSELQSLMCTSYAVSCLTKKTLQNQW